MEYDTFLHDLHSTDMGYNKSSAKCFLERVLFIIVRFFINNNNYYYLSDSDLQKNKLKFTSVCQTVFLYPNLRDSNLNNTLALLTYVQYVGIHMHHFFNPEDRLYLGKR